MYITVMSFFDTATASWYEGTSKERNFVGVAAFNPKQISGQLLKAALLVKFMTKLYALAFQIMIKTNIKP